MASHRADGSAFRRPSDQPRGRRRAEPPPRQRGRYRAEPEPRERGRYRAGPEPEPRERGRYRADTGPTWTSQLPQAGVVGVLGLATIVAPLAGDVLPSSGHTALARAAGEGQPARTAIPEAVHDFRVIPTEYELPAAPESVAQEAVHVPTPEELAAARQAADRASRDLARRTLEQEALTAAVPGCDAATARPGGLNGRLNTAELCELWGSGLHLRADAAVALARLSFAYRDHFGTDLVVTDAYRTYASQVSVRARKPGLAAVPGSSQHGWGLAVDLGGGVQNADVRYRWLRENGPAFGWDNPSWARRGGSGPYEPWHWEYVAGQR